MSVGRRRDALRIHALTTSGRTPSLVIPEETTYLAQFCGFQVSLGSVLWTCPTVRLVELVPEHDGALTFSLPQKSDVVPDQFSSFHSFPTGEKLIPQKPNLEQQTFSGHFSAFDH